MRSHNKLRSAYSICIAAALLLAAPFSSNAQHFGHGGGGGGARGGGGAPRAGGGGFGGGGHAPVQVAPRSINGGARNFGNHPMPAGRGDAVRGGGGRGYFGGGFRGDNAFHHVSGFHPYYYHPYHPYVWGPYWHPFGFFAAGLTANAIMFNWAGANYYYDNGVYYQPYGSGYNVVAPPVGAVVSYLPSGYQEVQGGDGGNYFYYGGTFYVSQGGSFRVVPGPVGAIVTEIPQGATDQQINGQDYLLYNNTYYAPISQNGQDAYEVVQVN